MEVDLLFYAFCAGLIISSIITVVSRHSIFGLLSLVSCFIFASFLLFLLECEFLALLFIIVYVGAIAVLFLFAVMMLESKQINLSKNTIKYFPVSVIFSLCLLVSVLNRININLKDDEHLIFSSFYLNNFVNWYDLIDSTDDVCVYGQILYTYFVLQFLISGLILLLVLIGVVYLTNSLKKYTKQQSKFKQLSRKAKIF
jgi:NADH-quinone oxidoreductase subunit J